MLSDVLINPLSPLLRFQFSASASNCAFPLRNTRLVTSTILVQLQSVFYNIWMK